MCNFYVMYWAEGGALNTSNCFRDGPPMLYWTDMGLSNIPEYEASHLPAEMEEEVKKHAHHHG